MNPYLKRAFFTTWICVSATVTFAQPQFPLKSATNSRYLIDQKNKPFPILGRTAWCITTQPVAEYKKFLANTLTHGYNAIEMSILTHWPNSNHPPFNGKHELPFLKQLNGETWKGNLLYKNSKQEAPDYTTPNSAFWNYADDFLGYCESKGILVLMFPSYVGWQGGDQGWLQEMVANGPEKVEAYGRWVASRFIKRKNIVWMLLGDMGKFNPEQKDAEAALIRGLKSVKGQQSIQYSAESESGENSASNADFGKEMTLNGAYTWAKITVPFMANTAYAHQPAIPSFLLEEPYDEEGPDGNNFNPNAVQPVRRFQWWGWLGTRGGYMAGNGFIWPFIDPFWQKHLNTQAAMDMERLNGFIKSIDWWKLVPSMQDGMRKLITDASNSDTLANYVAASAADDGSLLVAYIPPAHEGEISIDLSGIKNNLTAYWFDPSGGTYTIAAHPSALNKKGIQKFKVPGKNKRGEDDRVLILKEPAKMKNTK